MMTKNFVRFLFPGAIVSDCEVKEIASWNVSKAKALAEAHSLRPYAFRFETRSRDDDELDSKITATSVTYYLRGKIQTLEELRTANRREDKILIENMECNGWDRVVRCDPYSRTQPLRGGDVVLEPTHD